MLGGEYDVLHSGILSHQHETVGVETYGVESACSSTIFADRNLAAVHDPLRSAAPLVMSLVDTTVDGVRSPVDKHSELGILPPFHFLLGRYFIFLAPDLAAEA